MSLAFDAPDFHPHAAFALDLARTDVTWPFQVFADGAGRSTWKRQYLGLTNAAEAIYTAAAEDPSPTDAAGAIGEAFQYVAARLRANQQTEPVGRFTVGDAQSSSTVPAPPAPARIRLAGLVVGRPADTCYDFCGGGQPIANLRQTSSGILITFEDGTQEEILLVQKVAVSPASPSLTVSPLASDPRVHLPPKSPGDGTDDPPNKTAVIIAPFDTSRFFGTYALLTGSSFGLDMHREETGEFGEADKLDEIQTQLAGDGYSVKAIKDRDVTVPAMVEALSHSPGVVIISTHGDADGYLAVSYAGSSEEIGTSVLHRLWSTLGALGDQGLFDPARRAPRGRAGR